MQSAKIHYVYIHKRKTDGSVFYVGKGINRRAWSNSGRNRHWHRIVAKHGYEIQIVMSGLSEVCAFSMEAALIKFHGRDTLCNLTDGGDVGPVGLKHSEEFRANQRARLMGNSFTKGRVMPEAEKMMRRGKKQSAESIARRNETRRLRYPPKPKPPKIYKPRVGMKGPANPAYGIPKTPEQKARLREAMLGRRFKPESIAARSGENHPRYDATIYTMIHPDKGETSGTRHELSANLGLRKNAFTSLLNGSKKSTAGWKITR